ncbi:unnamed protein product [Linum trigynum]|uniref:Uncharacterized protein n=1 Tax=Linum trigynum TaxID=586398 RepID=A0AAV2ENE3_9ROSI
MISANQQDCLSIAAAATTGGEIEKERRWAAIREGKYLEERTGESKRWRLDLHAEGFEAEQPELRWGKIPIGGWWGGLPR